MIRVFYEKYWNDFVRKSEEKSFEDLKEVEEWIFGQMQQPYKNAMSFPTPAKCERIHANGPWEIEFTPSFNGPNFWIHQIENSNGIIFSDGKRTNGQRHWSKAVQEWLVCCDERKLTPKLTFVE